MRRIFRCDCLIVLRGKPSRDPTVSRYRDLGTRGDGRYRVVEESRVVANLVRNLWPYEAAADYDGATATARQVLETWIGSGLPCRILSGQRYFDPCEVANFALQAWLDDGDPLYLNQQVASSRRMVRAMRATQHKARRLDLSFRRSFNPQGLTPGRRTRLRLPLPIEPAAFVSARMLPDATVLGARLTPMPGRLEASLSVPSALPELLAIEAQFHLDGGMTGLRLTEDTSVAAYDHDDPDYRLYTRQDEGLIRVSATVQGLAETLSSGEASPVRVLHRIWDYFVQRMRIGMIHYDELDADDPMGSLIDRNWCDCHTGSALFAALARARGIPARLVTGAVLYPVAPAQHSWLEVWLPPLGWLPVDIFGAFLAARRGDDAQWQGCFFGELDPRLVTQRLPQHFVGAVGVRVPQSWYLLQRLTGVGTEQTLGCLDARAWVLRDEIEVRCEEPTRVAG